MSIIIILIFLTVFFSIAVKLLIQSVGFVLTPIVEYFNALSDESIELTDEETKVLVVTISSLVGEQAKDDGINSNTPSAGNF